MTLGDTVKGSEIGLKYPNVYVWTVCPDCQNERWVMQSKTKLSHFTGLCVTCSRKRNFNISRAVGKKHGNWKGGKWEDETGYIMIKLRPEDFFYPMANKAGYVKEHRLVMAKHLGRCLQSWEWVHHKGTRYTDRANKSDNLVDNLELSTAGSHSKAHSNGYRDGYKKGLREGLIVQKKRTEKAMLREFVEWLEEHQSVPYELDYVILKGDVKELKAKLAELEKE